MSNDWRYSKERLELRDNVLHTLLKKFGSYLNEDGTPTFSNRSLYECAHDWVSSGRQNSEGIYHHYMKNYT